MADYDGMLLGAAVIGGNGGVMVDGGGGVMVDGGGEMIGGGNSMGGMDGTETGTGVKDPILSNVPFVAGTISAALVLGIVFGVLLGKKRIKKGFDLYEN
ncbi:MAG: hypothetical protein OSJ38_00945 [Lachnospiraceae bacterium]|nr:hypothetical protein [Lachnospiraceae bacterium]MCX4345794.1 hypothetical protein [Lachnospiraceae bacterium]